MVALSIFLFGAVGLAIDGSHLYAQRQMAQAAADAAAEAGILSVFNGSNATGAHGFSTTGSFTCATNDARTPCYYAQTMNGFNGTGDTVTVDFPSAATVGVPTGVLSSSDPVTLLRVTIQRQVDTTLIGMLGTSASTIGASGTAAIVSIMSPIPIVVTHPTLAGSFNVSGTGSTAKIKICGGPSRSIEVNSSDGGSMSWTGNPVVDLSQAGPNDPGDCSTGTGADFGDFGGPRTGGTIVSLGTTGRFIQPASPVLDPLANVSPPPAAGPIDPAPVSLGNGVSGCPASPAKPCFLYSPGQYTSTLQVKNITAVFKPGIYFMNGASLDDNANGTMLMATGFTDPATPTGTGTGWSGNIMFYFTGPGSPAAAGAFGVSANAGSGILVGSPAGSAYKGILVFANRNAAAQTYTFDGGGGLHLTGTIYTTNSLAVMTAHPSQYQTLNFQGNAGSSTRIVGEIITSSLVLSGTPGVVMNLNPAATAGVRQVALVN